MAFINGVFSGHMTPTTTLAGCIDIFENAWPNPVETIAMVEKACLEPTSGMSWVRAATLNMGTAQNHRTNYNMGITHLAKETGTQVAMDVHNQMYFLLLSTTIPYAQKHDLDELFHEGYNMLKYSTGQEYKAHADGETITGRSVSAIIYLNDDYEGGEVEFVNFGIKIKPKAGMLLLFPSNYAYRHIAHPVTSGTKYALVTWIKDRYIP